MTLPRRILLGIITFLCSCVVSAVTFHTVNARYLLSFEQVTLPNANPSMGLLGMHYLLHPNAWFYGGVGGYGAVMGERGGLFVLGVDAGLQHRLFRHVHADIGFFVGGGGGRNNLNDEGSGLMLRPSVTLSYYLRGYQLGLGYSYVTFPQGSIRSHNVTFSVAVPTHFHYLDSDDANQGQSTDFSNLVTLGLHRTYFSMRNQTLLESQRTIQLIGIEGGADFKPNWFGYWQAAGAYAGLQNGYMEMLGGVGHRFLSHHRLRLETKLGLGAAGGGGAETGGGFVVKPEVIALLNINHAISLGVGAGYLWSPTGSFHAPIVLATLTHHFNLLTPTQKKIAQTLSHVSLQNWSVMLSHITYLGAQRSNMSVDENKWVDLIGIDMHYLLTPTFYVIGEGASAYAGHAGSYATGFFGLGLQSKPFFSRLRAHAALLGGAAGGGGMDVHHGLVWQPRIGLSTGLSHNLAAVLDFSRIQAVHGRLNTSVITLGIQFHFAGLKAQQNRTK